MKHSPSPFGALFEKTEQGIHTQKPYAYGPVFDVIQQTRLVRTILEIGVLSGASLRAWQWAWPSAEIWGVDLDLRRVHVELPRVHLIEADGGNPKTLALLPGSFDLIVDDGSHACEAQQRVLENLYTRLAPGGTYVIEDIMSDLAVDYLTADAQRFGLTVVGVLKPPAQETHAIEYRVLTLRAPGAQS